MAWCRERLAHFKCPRDVHFVAELPRNATGKLLKTGCARSSRASRAESFALSRAAASRVRSRAPKS